MADLLPDPAGGSSWHPENTGPFHTSGLWLSREKEEYMLNKGFSVWWVKDQRCVCVYVWCVGVYIYLYLCASLCACVCVCVVLWWLVVWCVVGVCVGVCVCV